jgi:hypothetical protein
MMRRTRNDRYRSGLLLQERLPSPPSRLISTTGYRAAKNNKKSRTPHARPKKKDAGLPSTKLPYFACGSSYHSQVERGDAQHGVTTNRLVGVAPIWFVASVVSSRYSAARSEIATRQRASQERFFKVNGNGRESLSQRKTESRLT